MGYLHFVCGLPVEWLHEANKICLKNGRLYWVCCCIAKDLWRVLPCGIGVGAEVGVGVASVAGDFFAKPVGAGVGSGFAREF